MTFKEFAAELAKDLGADIETEGDVCAVRVGAPEGEDSLPKWGRLRELNIFAKRA